MCGPYIHATFVGEELVMSPMVYNSHSEIEDYGITPEILKRNQMEKAVQMEESRYYQIRRVVVIKPLGVQIEDGKPTIKRYGQEVSAKMKTELKTQFMAQFPTPESLIPWIRAHYGQRDDERQWRSEMPTWLSSEGQMRLLRNPRVWAEARAPRPWPSLGPTETETKNEKENNWTLDDFCDLFVQYPNAYWKGCQEAADRKQAVAIVKK